MCNLNKSLYGLRQASRPWFQNFSSTMMNLGFKKSSTDHTLFTKGSGKNFIALLVYVDDIIISRPNQSLVSEVQALLQKHFNHKVIGDPKVLFGIGNSKIQTWHTLVPKEVHTSIVT